MTAVTTAFHQQTALLSELRPTRIAPSELPVRFQAAPKALRRADADYVVGPMDVELSAQQVVMCRTVAKGLPIRLSVQIAAYDGVAARIETGPTASDTKVCLELLHTDPSLTVPLSKGEDFQSIAADWKQWSEVFGLPMVLVEADGSMTMAPATALKPEAIVETQRRSHLQIAGRRGRFQRRRKCGQSGLVQSPIAGAREIIARN